VKKLKNVIISGYYGFGNIGDESILYSIISSIKNTDKNVKITVLTSSYRDTSLRYDVDVVSRNNIKGIIRAIKKCDIFISGGGTLFQDVTSRRSFIFYMAQIIMALKFKKEVFIYAQGVGPLNNKLNKLLFKHFINKVKYITIRDEDSYNELKNLKVIKPNIKITADPVFYLQDIFLKCNKAMKSNNFTVGICIREWIKTPNLYKDLAVLCDMLINKLNIEVKFIPFDQKNDYLFSKKVIDCMENKCEIITTEGISFEKMVSIIKSMDFILGMRLHALIFASICNIPFSGITYDPKIDAFLKRIDKKPVLDVHNIDEEKIVKAVDSIKNEFNDMNFISYLDELENLAKENINYFFKALNFN
jgi:polysaccharide pyruvyl transferase CsaB